MDGGVHCGSYRFVDGDPHAVGLLLGCATADYPGGAGWYPTCPGGIIRTAIHRLRRRSWSVLDVDASLPAARDVPPNRSVHLRQTFPGGHPHRDHRAVYDRRPMAVFEHESKTQTILAAIAAVQASVNLCATRLSTCLADLNNLNAKVNILMSEQSEVDADTATLVSDVGSLQTAIGTISTNVAALQAAIAAGEDPQPSLAALEAAIASVGGQVTSAQDEATASAPTTPVTGS